MIINLETSTTNVENVFERQIHIFKRTSFILNSIFLLLWTHVWSSGQLRVIYSKH